MRKTPSALKWLAERRARTAGELEQLERILQEVTDRRDKLQADLAGLDRSIQVFDPALRPDSIASARTNERYGPRGALRAFLLETLRTHEPEWVGSDVLELHLLSRYPMEFGTPWERKRWYCNSFKNALKGLANQGTIEREHNPDSRACDVVRWRVSQPKDRSLADLHALAAKGAESNDPKRVEMDGGEAGPRGSRP